MAETLALHIGFRSNYPPLYDRPFVVRLFIAHSSTLMMRTCWHPAYAGVEFR